MPSIVRRGVRAPSAYCTTLAPLASSAAEARRFVSEVLARCGVRSDDAQLLVSELVANAARHAGTPIQLGVLVGERVRVEVFDHDRTVPSASAAVPDAERGRGLWIVDCLATAWGVALTAAGKCVWFEADVQPAGALQGAANP